MLPGNLFAMFSNFRNFSNTLDAVLDSPDVTLEKVLDEENLLTALNSRNLKVLNFFTIEKLFTLLDFILEYPPEGSDPKRCFRYPFIATEILCSDSPAIYEKISESGKFFHIKLFKFLDSESNSIQAGYYSRVLLNLLSKGPGNFLYLLTELEYLCKLVNFVQFRSVCEVIEKILILEFDLKESFFRQRIDLLNVVFGEAQGAGVRGKNAAGILVNLLSWQGEIKDSQSFLEYFQSSTFISTVFNHLENENMAQILKSLTTTTLGGKAHKDLILENLLNSLENIENLLNSQEAQYHNTLQEPSNKLGKLKLSLIQIIISALQSKNETFCKKLTETGILNAISQLFWTHEWNSFLHCQFFLLCETILMGPFSDTKKIFLHETGLVQKLIDRFNSNPRKKTYHPEIKPGYDGVLIKIANLIEKISYLEPIKSVLAGYPWQLFKTSTLNSFNYIANRELGGYSMKQFDTDFILPLPNEDSAEPDLNSDNLSVDELYWRF